MDLMDYPRLLLFLLTFLALCGVTPLIGVIGLRIGRMQVTDEIDRGDHPTYTRKATL